MKLQGKVALVTGAGSGIGRATAKVFAREGARVGLLVRKEEKGKKLQEEIEADGGEALTLLGDITKPETMQKACADLAEKCGRIDIVFANAGINGVWSALDKFEVDEFRKTVQVNLEGTFITLKTAYPHMRAHGGVMLITASINGTRVFSNTGATAYSATKAGVVAMANMLALELASDKIRVNVISPGAITTAIEEQMEKRGVNEAGVPVKFPEGEIPLTGGKPGDASQVADVALFLASEAASHVTGANIYVDGAQSLLKG